MSVPCVTDTCSVVASLDENKRLQLDVEIADQGGLECDETAGGLKVVLFDEENKPLVGTPNESCVKLRLSTAGELFAELEVEPGGGIGCSANGLSVALLESNQVSAQAAANVCKNLLQATSDTNELYVAPNSIDVQLIGGGNGTRVPIGPSNNGATSDSISGSLTNTGTCRRLYQIQFRPQVTITAPVNISDSDPGENSLSPYWKIQGFARLTASKAFITGSATLTSRLDKVGSDFSSPGGALGPDELIWSWPVSNWMYVNPGQTVNFDIDFFRGQIYTVDGQTGQNGFNVFGFAAIGFDAP